MNDIEKLNSVKFNIRKALESQGSDITVDTPFEEYPKYITYGGKSSCLPNIEITNEEIYISVRSCDFTQADFSFMGVISGDYFLSLNNEYKVTFDNEEYYVTPYILNHKIVIGNRHIFSEELEDTGEPFLIGYFKNYDVLQNLLVFTDSEDATHSIGINKIFTTPSKNSVLTVSGQEWITEKNYPGVVIVPHKYSKEGGRIDLEDGWTWEKIIELQMQGFLVLIHEHDDISSGTLLYPNYESNYHYPLDYSDSAKFVGFKRTNDTLHYMELIYSDNTEWFYEYEIEMTRIE